MSWAKEVEEINKRRELASHQGGKESVERHHAKGKLTVRERVDMLVDEGSFQEHGTGAGFAEMDENGKIESFTPANYVIGLARVNGQVVAVGGEDFTLKGGSPNAAGLRKSIYSEVLAVQYRVPLIRFLEGGGGSVTGAGKPQGPVGEPVFAGHRFQIIAEAMGKVPVVSAALGPVAGFPASRLVASHFTVMTKHTAQVLIGGPALVERALNRAMTKEELGGPEIHLNSGVVDNLAEDEFDAFQQIRTFLSYLPQNVWEISKRVSCADPPNRAEEALLSIVPRDRREIFDMREVIRLVMDQDSFFEIAPFYGLGQITGLARLQGQTVGVTGNDCRYFAGAMTAEGAQKVRRFFEMCDTFHLPIVNFVDEPGFMIGPEAEKSGTIRYGTSAVMAAAQSTVPWASILIHKSFGVASAAHFGPAGYVLAWPSFEAGALPIEGGVAVAYRREIAAAANPEEKRHQLEEKMREGRSPFPRAESFSIHDLIDPRQTRPMLCHWIEWIQPQLEILTGPVSFTMRP